MPIKIPNDLPAATTLEQEGVMVMSEATAARQDMMTAAAPVAESLPPR